MEDLDKLIEMRDIYSKMTDILSEVIELKQSGEETEYIEEREQELLVKFMLQSIKMESL